jgi:hypothetical protein
MATYHDWAGDIRRLWDRACGAHGWGLWAAVPDHQGRGWTVFSAAGSAVAVTSDEPTARLIASLPDLCEPSLRPVHTDPGGAGLLPASLDAVVSAARDEGYDEGYDEARDDCDSGAALDLHPGEWMLIGSPDGVDGPVEVRQIQPRFAALRVAAEDARADILRALADLLSRPVTPDAVYDAVVDVVTRRATETPEPEPYEVP